MQKEIKVKFFEALLMHYLSKEDGGIFFTFGVSIFVVGNGNQVKGIPFGFDSLLTVGERNFWASVYFILISLLLSLVIEASSIQAK